VLGFVSSHTLPRKYHQIRVKVSSANGDPLAASWRSGYYAPDSY
jgi:hypothetical protein